MGVPNHILENYVLASHRMVCCFVVFGVLVVISQKVVEFTEVSSG